MKPIGKSVYFRIYKLVRGYRWRFLMSTVCVIIGCLCNLLFGLMSRYAIDSFIMPGTLDGLGAFVAVYLGIMAVVLGLGFAGSHFCWRTEIMTGHALQQMTLSHVQRLPVSYFDSHPVGGILPRLFGDAGLIGDSVGFIFCEIPSAIVSLLLTAVTMTVLNWRLAVPIVLTMPVIALIILLVKRNVLRENRALRALNADITGGYSEGIGGALTIRALSAEAHMQDRFAALTRLAGQKAARCALMAGLSSPLVLSISGILVAYVLHDGHHAIQAGAMSAGTLVLFVQYITSIFSPIGQLVSYLSEMQSVRVASERVLELLDTPSDVMYAREALPESTDALPRIRLDGVSFAYSAGKDVLRGVGMDIPPGAVAALVGETGSGKTTIAGLICGFHTPREGRVLVNGNDLGIHRLPPGLIGYVPQQSMLFSGTVMENLKYARPDAPDEQAMAAAKAAGLHEFIRSLKDGYHTSIGEGGKLLSAGQRQLLSIARALLANPGILVFDEATSFIDSHTERRVHAAMATALRGRTGVVVAHRLSTIRNADVIYVMKDGCIVESGDHVALMSKKGEYYALSIRQSNEYLEREAMRAAAT